MDITTPYRPRATAFLGVKKAAGWNLKLYSISAAQRRPDSRLRKAAMLQAAGVLAKAGKDYPNYRAGFCILHAARDAEYIILAWWVGENMIRSRIFKASMGSTELTDIGNQCLMACVWEMKVIAFESRAWTRTVLKRSGKADIRAYLRLTLPSAGAKPSAKRR